MNGILVTLSPAGAVTTTMVIAEWVNIDHKSVIQLARQYQKDLEYFGEVAFEMRLNPQGSPTEYAILNEQQATLLISYMRNTEIVREFKIRLVEAFYNIKANAQNLAHSEEVVRKIVREELNSQKFTRLLQSFPLYDLKEVAELQAEQVEIRAENERSLRKLYQMETKQDSDKHMVEIAQNLARLVKAIEANKIPYFRSEPNPQNFARSNSQVSADSGITEVLLSILDGSPYISFSYTLDAVNRVRRTTTPELVHALKSLGYECAGRKRVDGIRQNIWYSTMAVRRPDLTKAALMISGRI